MTAPAIILQGEAATNPSPDSPPEREKPPSNKRNNAVIFIDLRIAVSLSEVSSRGSPRGHPNPGEQQ